MNKLSKSLSRFPFSILAASLAMTVHSTVHSAVATATDTAIGTNTNNNINISAEIVSQAPRLMVRFEHVAGLFTLRGDSQVLAAHLLKLKPGDVVIGNASVDWTNQRATLHALDTVGLKDVIGLWRTAKSHLFEFRDFQNLNFYVLTDSPSSTWHSTAPARRFQYTLAPDLGKPTWSIFMADRISVQIGSLRIQQNRMILTIYNNDTGEVAERFELKRDPTP